MTDQGGRPQAHPAGEGYRWQWRDAVIAALALALAVTVWLARGGGRPEATPAGGEAISVFEVVMDHEERRWLEILFDRPVLAEDGAVQPGDVLDRPPATIEPALAGVWRWRDRAALRFEPSGGLAPATRYRLSLIPDRILGPDQELAGSGELELQVDRFVVESVEVWEEPDDDGGVVLRGTVQFNYAVEPELLASHLRLEDPAAREPVEIQLEAGWRTPSIPFRTAPVRKQKQPRQLTLVVDGELTPADGNVPLAEPYRHPVPLGSSEVLEVRELGGQPGLDESTLRVVLSSAVSAELAGPYLQVTPETRFKLTAVRNALELRGPFTPGSAYRVRIAAGLPAADGATLKQAYDGRLVLANLAPSIDFQSQGMFLSRGGMRNLALETVNVNRFELAIDRVYRNNLLFLFRHQGDFDQESVYRGGGVWQSLGDRLVEQTVRVGGERNRKTTTVLSLDDWIDADAPGLYRVIAGRPDHWQAPQRWLLVTDLGLVAKQGEGEVMVWVLSHRTLAPVAGARVELVSDQNQTIGRGTTGADGTWHLRDPEALATARPFLVTVTRGDDFSFLHLDRMQVDTTGLDVAGDERPAGGYTAFLYGERDIYRPGETVRGAALVRDARLAPAPAVPALLRLRDPQGREIATRRLELDARGITPFEWPMPAYALTGRQSLELEIARQIVGRYRFQLEEFVPDRIKVEIRTPAEVAPGRPLGWTVAGSYLFGPPAAGLAAESRVRLLDATFTSPRHPEYSFRESERSFEERELFSRRLRLGDDGTAGFEADLPRERGLPSSLEALITARVQEEGGRGVTARSRLTVHPYPYYLGVKRRGPVYPELGQPVEIDWVAVAPDGTERATGPLVAELVLDRWQTVLRRTPAGGFRYESNRESVVVSRREIAGGAASGSFSFSASEYGSHRVVLSDPATGAATSVGFYTGGWGYSPWAVENPDRIELELDRGEYRPGETATVQVRAPFPGRLILAVEREELFTTQVHQLTGNTATLRLPVERSWRPNAYVTATLVRPVGAIEPGSVGRAFGAVPIRVDRAANRLSVAIQAPAQVRSESRLEIGVATAPGAAVTVAAVDEGILQLIAQQTPDPFEFFYRKLRLGVRSFDSFSQLLPEIEDGGEAGGGEAGRGAAQYVRTESIRRVKPVAFWSGVLTADGSGRARAAFELPRFTGGVRLMAVAADGARFGSADAMTRVRDPLVVTPTLPRVLSFDERLEVPVTVRNDTGRAGRFEVRLAASGAATAGGGAGQSVEIPDGGERTVYFAVATGGTAGTARFSVEARGNGETGRSGEVEVDVRPDLPPITTAASGALAELETELPAAGDGYRPGTVSRRLQVGPLPLVRFGRRLAELLRYPYGCLEQTVSRAFPLLYLDDLARQLEPELLDPEAGGDDVGERVEEALRRVAWHQVPGGGFALWRESRQAHPWSSVYAGHFLVEAERAGYPVDPQLTLRTLDHLRDTVRARDRYGREELERVVYALYVLARAGDAELGVMDFLRQRHAGNLGRASRALLAAAYAAVGNRDAVDELAAGLADVEAVERQTGENFRSTVRDRALLLLALLDAVPDSPRIPELAERLARDAGAAGGWTTQEAAFALVAVGQLAGRQAERPPYRGTAWVGSRRLGSFSSAATAVFDGITDPGPVRLVLEAGYRPGSAFYNLATRGVPRDDVYRAAAEGLEIQRLLFDRDGGPLDPAAVRQGDLVVVKTLVRSVAGPVDNVALVQLLPSGLEVENPRLATTESLPWIADANLAPDQLDLRDDRVLAFTDLPANQWRNLYSLLRAVAPGSFRLPPPHAEAMYNPALRATGERGRLEVAKAAP